MNLDMLDNVIVVLIINVYNYVKLQNVKNKIFIVLNFMVIKMNIFVIIPIIFVKYNVIYKVVKIIVK